LFGACDKLRCLYTNHWVVVYMVLYSLWPMAYGL
jgi:hypothetical protein